MSDIIALGTARIHYFSTRTADKSSSSNTLFWRDRTGSHYFYVMENTVATSDGNAWSGRFNPQFSAQVTTFMINPYLKFKGLEFFGSYERAEGRKVTEENKRTVNQYAADLIYRFPENNMFWIGGRYNRVSGTIQVSPKYARCFQGIQLVNPKHHGYTKRTHHFRALTLSKYSNLLSILIVQLQSMAKLSS